MKDLSLKEPFGTISAGLISGFLLFVALKWIKNMHVMRPAAFLMLLILIMRSTEAQSIQNVVDSYTDQYAQIRSISVDATVQLTSSVKNEDRYKQSHQIISMPQTHKYVYANDGRFYVKIVAPWTEVRDEVQELASKKELNDYQSVKELAEEVWSARDRKKDGRVYVFDGKHFRTIYSDDVFGTNNGTGRIVETKPLEMIDDLVSPNPLDWQMFGFPQKALPDTKQRKLCFFGASFNRIPYQFVGEENVGNLQCNRFNVGDHSLWFCPSLNNAIAKREFLYNNKLQFRVEMHGHQEIAKGVFFAEHIDTYEREPTERDTADSDSQSGFYAKYTLHNVKLNDKESESLLEQSPTAGDLVFDHTVHLDADSKEAISYIYPADERDLQKVVAEARKQSPPDPAFDTFPSRPVSNYRFYMMFFGVLSVFVAVFIWARLRGKP